MQGCVYEMSRDAYEALWRSEGGAMKKTPYQEVVVSVRDASGRDVDAITCQVCAQRRWRIDGIDVDKQQRRSAPGPPSDATASRPRGTSASSRRAHAS